jgi:hypothetical protein
MVCTILSTFQKLNSFFKNLIKEFEFQHIAGRYLQSTSVANQTIRNIPDLFLQGYDEFQKSFLNSTSSTMTVNELRSMLDTVLSSIPYDPNGIDAQIKFSTFIIYIGFHNLVFAVLVQTFVQAIIPFGY